MEDAIEQSAARAIRDCNKYMGFSDVGGISILCKGMAVALMILVAIYRRQTRGGLA